MLKMSIDEYGQIHRRNNTSRTPIPRHTAQFSQRQEQHTVRKVLVGLAAMIGVMWFISSVSQCFTETSEMVAARPPTPVSVTYATVRQDLNMRSGPGVSYTVVQILRANTKVEVVDNSGAWPKIRYNGREGFSYRDYLRIDTAPTRLPQSDYNAQATPPSYTRLSSTSPLPSINIENNTGYTASSVYVSRSDSNSWGSNKLSGSLQNGSYLKLQLADTLRTSNTYDIRLRMSDSIFYTKYNVRITDNAWIGFTSNDRD
jgi:hypothetical protein